MSENFNQSSFGPNTWLIDEMYRLFLDNPSSVSESWKEFLKDYKPVSQNIEPVKTAAIPSQKAKSSTEKMTQPPPDTEPLVGFAARIAENMNDSLSIPTATSTRIIPVKVMEENRRIINLYLADTKGGKISFTHIIAWAILKALKIMPVMTISYLEIEQKAYKVKPQQINFGLAVDIQKKDGSRSLIVPNIKQAEQYDFNGFFSAYNELLRKVKMNEIEPDDFLNTTVSLTNPGMIGTVHSLPRLMVGQSCIIATGAIDYPAEYHAVDPKTIAQLGISKTMTVTCTYDHRVIQGAESGTYLYHIHRLLNGEDFFYEEIFSSLHIPYQTVKLQQDLNPTYDAATGNAALFEKQARVLQLINMYRVRGHLVAHLNPLVDEIKMHSELDPAKYGLTLWDYDREFSTLGLAGKNRMTLRQVLDILREAYCRTIGIEYMHIQEPEQKEWIQQNVEGKSRDSWISHVTKQRILFMLNAAEVLETFLHMKYIGHKRFSLEGAETLIPMLDQLLTSAIDYNYQEIVFGMTHRGRLNVLANIFGKSYEQIFREFEDNLDPHTPYGTGDVKYHLGAEGYYHNGSGRKLKITLASNPSHLEAVDPVVEGMARAKQDALGDQKHEKILAVLIHGDASFAGQGVVAETFNLSALHGFRTGGTIHIVVNNGIGFTTLASEARSSFYATDIARMVQAPIFHVNAEDPEACIYIMKIALAFRHKFKKDVVIDMVCYRKHGHNETDEPSYTQPLMYAKIKEKRSIRKLYTENLVNRKDITLAEAENSLNHYQTMLNNVFETTSHSKRKTVKIEKEIQLIKPDSYIQTNLSSGIIKEITHALTSLPKNFTVHPKLKKQVLDKKKMIKEGFIDWSMAEAIAIGSLLLERVPVRLSGQDSRRGTFSQRHAVLVDYQTSDIYTPLNNIKKNQEKWMIYDSTLSELSILGFEYGYSVTRKDSLVIWEAQYGDFVNGAQIIIDQFLSSAEEKWGQSGRLVLLLPHGYEGQGPEHSSSRLERFLSLCTKGNIRVTVPTSAAQYFHLLRNQALHKTIKPLVVLTPKSLLRSEWIKSKLDEISRGNFNPIMTDPYIIKKPEKLILCSGKVAYDLFAFREQNKIKKTLIIRLEQLYPLPTGQITEIIEKNKTVSKIYWVQEEPQNMGAWSFISANLPEILPQAPKFKYIGRVPRTTPATGSYNVHTSEQEHLIRQAFE
jgi:2-oxoglutarate decarboxylase